VITVSRAEYQRYHNRYQAKDADARALASTYTNEPQTGRLLSDILKGGAL
jgi:hypothetical protein